jgi:tripartite-type tricarboxylate transporter receptor subunit TctC
MQVTPGARARVSSVALCTSLCLSVMLLTPLAAQAQSYPSKSMRIVVGFPAGGATDVVARAIAQHVSEAWGQTAVVDNRPGAASNIGAEAVAKSPADGYTMLMGSVSLSINPTLYTKLGYNALKDFTPVVQVTNTPFMLCSHPALPVKTMKELIVMAKAKPGQLQYGSAGNGSGAHLFTELFRSMAGIDVQHIPYKGAAPAMTDLLGGHIPFMFDNIITMWPQAKNGKLRCLAVTTATRSAIAPDVPTVAQAGVPGYEANAWFGLFVPTGTPAEAVEKINGEVNRALKLPAMRDRLLALGCEPAGGTSQQYGTFFRAEIDKWAKVVRSAGARLD